MPPSTNSPTSCPTSTGIGVSTRLQPCFPKRLGSPVGSRHIQRTSQSGKFGSSPQMAEPTALAAALPTLLADVLRPPIEALSVLR